MWFCLNEKERFSSSTATTNIKQKKKGVNEEAGLNDASTYVAFGCELVENRKTTTFKSFTSFG